MTHSRQERRNRKPEYAAGMSDRCGAAMCRGDPRAAQLVAVAGRDRAGQGRGQEVVAYDVDQITGRRGGLSAYLMTCIPPGSGYSQVGLAGDRGL